MLTKNENLLFLQKKIGEIKIARFSAEIDAGLQLPNNIISTLKTDSDGNIWFFSSCRGEHAKNIDQDFYAYLEYYQKGGAYRLRTGGRATIIQDETVPYYTKSKNSIDNLVLIRFKIMTAEYFEEKALQTSSLKTRVKDFFTEMLYSQRYRKFDFAEAAM